MNIFRIRKIHKKKSSIFRAFLGFKNKTQPHRFEHFGTKIKEKLKLTKKKTNCN